MKHILLCAVAVAALPISVSIIRAADSTYISPSGTGSFTDSTKWNNGVPGATGTTTNGDTATFGSAITGNHDVNVDANRNVKNITFDSAARNYFLTGGSFLLTNGGAITSQGVTNQQQGIATSLTLQGDGGAYSFINNSTGTGGVYITGAVSGVSTGANVTTLTLGGTGTQGGTTATARRAEVNGAISDGVGGGKLSINKTGTGNWYLSGTNTYTGGTTIGGGTLFAISAGALGTSGNIAFTGGILQMSVATDYSARIKNSTSAISLTSAVDVDFTGVIDSSNTGGLTKAGANTLTLSANDTYTGLTTISAGTLQIGNGATAGNVAGDIANATALIFNRSNAITYGGVISGVGTVTKTGAGTLTLNGANTFNGATTLTTGGIQLGNANALQNSALSLANGTTLSFSSGITGPFTVAGLTGVAGSTVALTDTASAAVTLQVGSNNASTTYAGTISGNGALAKVGTGILTLSGANTFTGGLAIRAGTVSATTSANALGADANTVTLGDATLGVDAGLRVNGAFTFAQLINVASGTGTRTITGLSGASLSGGITLNNDVTLTNASSGSTVAVGGPISGTGNITTTSTLSNAVLNLSGNITHTGDITFNNSSSSRTTLSGTVNNTGRIINQSPNATANSITGTIGANVTSIVENSTAPLTISGTGTNTFAGSVLIQAGTVNVSGSNTALGAGGAGNTVTLGEAVTGAGNVTLNSGGTQTYAQPITVTAGAGTRTISSTVGSGNFSGAVALNNDLTVTSSVTGTTSVLTLSGPVSGAGAVTKTGVGNVAFSGANTYSGGTTVSTGTLLVNNATGSGTGSGAVTVAPGAAISGTGTIGGATTVNGMLAVGATATTTTPALLTFSDTSAGALTLTSTSVFDVATAGTRGVNYDAVTVGGTLTYGGTLTVNFATAPAMDSTYDLFDFGAEDGMFSAITFNNPSYAGTLDYGTGILTITAVPEPATWVSMGLLTVVALAHIARRSRRRNAGALV